MVEAFWRIVTDACKKKRISGITLTRNMPNITLQQYANNTILPRTSTIKEAIGLKTIIKMYMEAFSQKVNELKSEIFFINTKLDIEKQICKIMGYKKGVFPCKYLGIALEKGSKLSKIWCNTLKKMDAKLSCWKDKWLR